MKRKLLSILLCTAMTAAMLTGCGSKPAEPAKEEAAAPAAGGEEAAEAAEGESTGGKTVIRMTYWNSEDTVAAMLDYLAEAVPDVEIEYLFIDNSNYDTIVDTQLSAEEGPDIICESPGSALKHARLGYLASLDDLAGKYS